MRRTLMRSFSFFVLLAVFMAPVALAQGGGGQQQPPPPQQQQQAPDVDVSDEELETVAEVYLKLEEVQEKYREDFNETQDPEAAQELQQQLQQEANQVIEDHEGITPDRYDEIIRAAQADPELRDQLLAKIEELESGGDTGTR